MEQQGGQSRGQRGCLLFTGSETSGTGADVGTSLILVCLLGRVSEELLAERTPVLQPCNPVLDVSVERLCSGCDEPCVLVWSCEEGPAGLVPSGCWFLGLGVLSTAFPPC